MKNKITRSVMILVFLSLMVLVATSGAQGIKERMKQRLPAIVELKAQGLVGEDNQGYLAFVTDQKSQEEIVASENADRKAVYAQIAQQQGTTLDLVEKRRAMTLAERAIPGEYIQKADGSWVKK
ncbi:MAG: YdbL family protein [Proteobacteria bacterium]|nr:YdbL family protein [Pseudomonadota bacterium]